MTLHSPALTRFQESVLFIAAIICLILFMLPGLGLFCHQSDILANENRKISPFPPHATMADWMGFPQAFEAYFADRFAFRQPLTRVHHQILVRLFHRSPSSQVLIADNGWLFLQGPQGNAIVDLYHRNIKPFSEKEISIMHDEMTRRRQWVESWGGKAIFVLVPEKEAIYPERLPDIFQKQANPGSRYDQWTEIFAKDPSLAYIDLRPALLGGKSQGLLYFLGDSHWNSDGAYIGYSALVNSLQQWFPAVSLVARGEKFEGQSFQGGLARMLAVGNRFDEINPANYINPLDGTLMKCARSVPSISDGVLIPKKSEPIVYECNNTNLPSAVLIRDSMANQWLQWLPDNFRRFVVMYNWCPAAKVIEQERPDVVIFENAGRNLDQFLSVHLEFDSVSNRSHFTWEH